MQGIPICRDRLETTVSIAAAATASGVINVGRTAGGTFQVPAAITGATITVQYSNDGTNWTTALPQGDETNPITVAANGTYLIPASAFRAKYLRLLSASSEAAARTFIVVLQGS